VRHQDAYPLYGVGEGQLKLYATPTSTVSIATFPSLIVCLYLLDSKRPPGLKSDLGLSWPWFFTSWPRGGLLSINIELGSFVLKIPWVKGGAWWSGRGEGRGRKRGWNGRAWMAGNGNAWKNCPKCNMFSIMGTPRAIHFYLPRAMKWAMAGNVSQSVTASARFCTHGFCTVHFCLSANFKLLQYL